MQLLDERQSLASAVIEMEQDIDEHNLVLKNLEQQQGSKKAWNLVGEVLVERTVEEVTPEVTKKRDQMIAARDNMKKQLDSKQKEILAFQEKFNIRIKGEEGGDDKKGASSGKNDKSSSQGVLVSSWFSYIYVKLVLTPNI